MSGTNSWYIHVDLDAFFASVEQLDHPEYRGKPVIVGGKPEDRRGVVSTASYEARKFGVHSAMPSFKAYQLCPQGIFVHGRHQRYSEISYQIMTILMDYSPDVEQMSIDEAFIDLTGTEQLFGSPQQTSLKIQKRIFDETGLTVSIGLARTKYFAKMASDINKPNGFYFVEPGKESEFMLSLPVKKIWGVGTKTQELLYDSGIKTTRDIYEKDLSVLQFIAGKSTGQFLYNIVRGISDDVFQKERKSHSISAETTFPYDVGDIYTVETTILELCHDVMFRLLRENCFSKTVMIKIRYEDFTTVSIQQTYDSNILTLDSLYKSAKELFEKKYDTSRKVRLIGTGLENLESSDSPYQQDLFGNSNQKKMAVEKAILNMGKKHPEIKIRKARLIKNLMLFMILLCGLKTKVHSQDSNLQISGFWTADVTQTINTSFGNGTSFAHSLDSPVFKQQIDLSIFYKLNPEWYFNCIFADSFNQNTFTLCFTKESTLKKFYLSNRDIIFPKDYSVNRNGFGVPGGNNQSPGFYFHFEDIRDKKWSSDIMLRYDLTKLNSRTWYGNSLVNDTLINPQDYLRSKIFVIPCGFIDKIQDVYAENQNGSHKDKYNIKYKKLSSSDYFIDRQKNLLIISNNAALNNACNILITFENQTHTQSFIESIGDYSLSSTYLGEIQEYFKVQMGSYVYELENRIDGKQCVMIQNSNLFSPFLYSALYDSGIQNSTEFSVIQKNNEQIIEDYRVFRYGEDFNFAREDFFYDSHFYAQIIKTDSYSTDYTSPQIRYPFANADPYIYLTKNNYTDLALRCRLFNETSYYDIGKNASEGTVCVYINGKQDSLASYDKNSGFITLSIPVTPIDKIYIVWSEESNQFENGTITAAAGFMYNFTDFLKADSSVTVKWPLSSFLDSATYDNSLTGFASINGGINYSYNNFSVSDALSLAFQNPNVKGKYKVELLTGDCSRTYYFAKQTEDAQSDSQISGYRIPVSWDFSSYGISETARTYRDIKLMNGELLFKSDELEIALKADNIMKDYKIYVQLGIDYENETLLYDNLPVWEITSLTDTKVLEPFDTVSTEWQKIRLKISEKDRIKLLDHHDLRIIVEKTISQDDEKTGILYAGPYEPKIRGCYVLENDKILVQTSELEQSENNFLTQINFHKLSSVLTENEKKIKAVTFFNESPFNDYEDIYFNLQINFDCDFTYILDSRTDYDFIFDKALELTIFTEKLKLYKDPLKVHQVRINVKKQSVFIDDQELSSEDFSLFVNSSVTPFRQVIILKTSDEETGGTALIGNLFYKNNKIYSILKNTIDAQYSFSNENIESKTKVSSIQNLQSDFTETAASVNLWADTSLKTKALNFDAGFEIKNNQHNPLDNAGHSIITNYPLFKFLKFSEKFIYDRKSSTKNDNVSLDFTSLDFPLEALFSVTAQNSGNYSSQSERSDLNFTIDLKKLSFISKSSLLMNQKSFDSSKLNENYFINWWKISMLQFSPGIEDAQERSIDFSTILNLEIPDIKTKPFVKFTLCENFSNTFIRSYKDSVTFELTIPFQISSDSLSFIWQKTAGDTTEKEDYFKNNYSVDFENLFCQQKNYSYFYSSFVFADLFSDISSKIKGKQFYNAKYILNYKRKLNNSLFDFFVPYSVSASVIRDVYLTQQKNDLYQFKISASNASVNLFGSNSKYKTFKWYTQDEFLMNNSLIIRLPEKSFDQFSYLYNLNTSALFYVNSSNTLKSVVNLFTGSEQYLNLTITQIWNHSKKSKLWFTQNKTADYKRREIFNVNLINKDKVFSQKYEYIHNLDIVINKNWTLKLNSDIFFLHEENKCSNLGLELTAGVKLEF